MHDRSPTPERLLLQSTENAYDPNLDDASPNMTSSNPPDPMLTLLQQLAEMQRQNQQFQQQILDRQLHHEQRQLDHEQRLATMFTTQHHHSSPAPSVAPSSSIHPDIQQVQEDIKTLLTDKCRVTLSLDNFESWRMAIVSDADLIQATQVLETAAPPDDNDFLASTIWSKKNTVLRARMLNAMTSPVRERLGVTTHLSASGIWEKVNALFGKSLAEERFLATKSLRELTLENGDYLTYQARFQQILTRLQNLGETLPDFLAHDFFIHGLGSWNRTFIKTRLDEFFSTGRGPIQNLDLFGLMAQLASRAGTHNREGNARKDPNSSPGHAKPATNKPSGTGSQDGSKPTCSRCNRRHSGNSCFYENPSKAPEWWKKKHPDLFSPSQPQRDAPQPSANPPSADIPLFNAPHNANSAVAGAANNHVSYDASRWLADSCASYHLTPDRSLFLTYTPVTPIPSDAIEDAKGDTAICSGIGTVHIPLGDHSLTLSDVRHIPSFAVNLISLGQLANQQYQLHYSADNTAIHFTSVNGSQYEARLTNNNIYQLAQCLHPGDDLQLSASAFAAPGHHKISLPILDWHRRLCHLNQADLLRLAHDPESCVHISGTKDLPFCDTCHQSRQTRQYGKIPRSRATKPLMRVHLDIAGGGRTLDVDHDDDSSIPASRIGAKYVLFITDDATRYRWCFFLSHRSAAIVSFRHWLQSVKNQGFSAPAFVVSDNEFYSKDWAALYNSEGITWQPSAPHSPWQNPVSERTIRIIFERTRSAMIDAPYIPPRFWQDAVQCVTTLTNYLPTSTFLYNSPVPGGVNTNPDISPSPYRTPMAAWINSPVDFSWHRRWGCPVWVHRHGADKPTTKFDSRSTCCFVLGHIAAGQYRVWDPRKDTVFNTNDVIFNESHQETPVASAPIQSEPTSSIPSDHDDDVHTDWFHPASGRSFAAAALAFSARAPDTPTSYTQALTSTHAALWRTAMDAEVQELKNKGCWRLVRKDDLPPGTRVIPGRWVYKQKETNDQSLPFLAKARWVIRGNLLDKSYIESYSPVASEQTTRLLYALASIYRWHIFKADAILAFLNGKMPAAKRVYMYQPHGYAEGEKGLFVCELLQALYGLIPSARIWYDTLASYMRTLNFRCSAYDSALWCHCDRHHLYVSTHVDDFQIYCESASDGKWFLSSLAAKFAMKDANDEKYLGVTVHRSPDRAITTLSQRDYALDLVNSFGLGDAHPVKLPMDPDMIIDDSPDPNINIREYQRGTGGLNWLSTKTRPDITRTSRYLSRFNARPTPKSWQTLKHCLRYVKGSLDYSIIFSGHDIPSPFPTAFSDSDWGGPHTGNRRSVTGYVFLLAGGPIAWNSQTQTSVALSSNEAEYMAASDVSRDAVWLRNLFFDFNVTPSSSDIPFPPLPIYLDNAGALSMTGDTLVTKRSKHIDIRFHYVREKVQDGLVRFSHCSSNDNVADGLTKPLRADKFSRFLHLLGISVHS